MTTMITGVTGTIGGQVADALLTRGESDVQVATRRPEAAAKWEERGARVVQLDLLANETLSAAFDSVDRLFLVGPQPEGFGAHVANVITAAKDAGVTHIVRLSGIGASVDGPFSVAKEHGLADQALRDSGVGYTILQPTFFQDNFVNFQGDAIRAQNVFYGSSGDGKTSYVSGRDIGRAAAEILRAPDEHAGKIYALTGPEAHADAEIATLLTELLGRKIQYVDVPPDQMRTSMIDKGTPAWMADALVALEGVKRAGFAEAISPHLAQLLDTPPENLRQFIDRNRGKLG